MRLALLGSLIEVRADEPVAAAVSALFDAPPAAGAEPAAVVTATRAGTGTAGTGTSDSWTSDSWTVTGPQGPLTTTSDAHALELVLSQVNAVALAGCAGFAVHAGVVARAGLALALPGASGLGKSTLVACLLQAGWDYVSDEALVADRSTGALTAYPKPLTLLSWTLDRLGLEAAPEGRQERSLRVAELGAQVAADPVRLAQLVLPRRGPGPVAAVALHRAEAAMALLTHSFNHWTDPAGSLRTAADLARGAQCWTLDYDDPVEAAELLSRLAT